MTDAKWGAASEGHGERRRLLRPRIIGFGLGLTVCCILAGLAVWTWTSWGEPSGDPLERGWQAAANGDLAKASQCLTELKQQPNRQVHAKFLRAVLILKRGFPYPALSEFEQIKDDPKLRVRALTSIGEAWYRLGRHYEVKAALEEALKHDPEAVDAHRWLAASYYDLGAIHEAVHHLKRTAELDLADQRPSRLLGLIHKDYERYEEAIPHYVESLSRKDDQPDWIQVRQELAACQVKARRHRDALATLASCPDSPGVLVLRAECHQAIGEIRLSKTEIDKALATDPDNLDGLLLQATMLLEEKRHDEAIEVLQRAAHKHPQDYTVHFKLAQAHAQLNHAAEAAAEQKIADRIRDVRRVFAELHEAAWNNPEDIRIRLRLAQLAKELGRPDLEDVWLKSAAALRPVAVEPSEVE